MRLSETMKKKGMTTRQLADATGISKRTLESYRTGRREPGFRAGLLIARALEVDPFSLINDNDEEQKD